MTTLSVLDGPLVVRGARSPHGYLSRYAGLHALVPIFVVAALGAVAYAFAGSGQITVAAIEGVSWMAGLMIASALLAVLAPLFKREVAEVTFDERRGQAHFLMRGPFAYTVSTVPLERITACRVEVLYDDTGKKRVSAILDIRGRRSIELPAGIATAELEHVRSMIARRSAPATTAPKRSPYEAAARRLARDAKA